MELDEQTFAAGGDSGFPDAQMRRALQLSSRNRLVSLPIEELLARAPTDWAPGEADVHEFLKDLRNPRDEQ